MNRVDIRGDGNIQTIHVDGRQILAKTARLDLDTRGIPVLTVTLPVIRADIDAGVEAKVVLDDTTHMALIAMGWTPPGGEA